MRVAYSFRLEAEIAAATLALLLELEIELKGIRKLLKPVYLWCYRRKSAQLLSAFAHYWPGNNGWGTSGFITAIRDCCRKYLVAITFLPVVQSRLLAISTKGCFFKYIPCNTFREPDKKYGEVDLIDCCPHTIDLDLKRPDIVK